MNTVWRCAPILLALLLIAPAHGAKASKYANFLGDWTVNHEESDKLIIEYEEGGGLSGGNFKPRISVAGIPLPGGARPRPQSGLTAKDPYVLRCTDLQVELHSKANRDQLKFLYDQSEHEYVVMGEYRGRTTKISRKKIKQTYKTTERRVTKTWTIRSDERLLVTVKVKPIGDKARTYSRVFDRGLRNTDAIPNSEPSESDTESVSSPVSQSSNRSERTEEANTGA